MPVTNENNNRLNRLNRRSLCNKNLQFFLSFILLVIALCERLHVIFVGIRRAVVLLLMFCFVLFIGTVCLLELSS